MYRDECSCIRCYMASGVMKEAGSFLLEQKETERIKRFNNDLRKRNDKVINWLKTHGAPAELIKQAEEDANQGNNAIMTVYDEIRLSGRSYWVLQAEDLEKLLEAAGTKGRALFIQLCQQYSNKTEDIGDKDFCEEHGRP